MEKWEVKPLESVGKIRFGMSRDEVHGLFEEQCTEFKKSKFSKNTTDDYGKFHVFYTADDKVDAVEFFEGVELTVNNFVIFPASISDVEGFIPKLEKDGTSYTSVETSIGIEAAEGKIESILIGAKGYYGE